MYLMYFPSEEYTLVTFFITIFTRHFNCRSHSVPLDIIASVAKGHPAILPESFPLSLHRQIYVNQHHLNIAIQVEESCQFVLYIINRHC